jgi:IS5 family transposase
MSICFSGLFTKLLGGKISIKINKKHPLIQLSNMLNWHDLSEIVLPDLKATTAGGKWWLGRKLKLRIHLGAYLLQHLFNKTDRQVEYDLKDNAAYQIFCGIQIVDKWHCPDHTKIEEFRSRLSPDTQQKLANIIVKSAVKLGFADPKVIDIDSTKQEANMSYPSDASLLCKLAWKIKKVVDYVNDNFHPFCSIKPMEVNLKSIKNAARKYFFAPKGSTIETKTCLLRGLLDTFNKETRLAISNIRCLSFKFNNTPWNIAKSAEQIINLAPKYLEDVEQFLDTGSLVPGKILSFHLSEVACMTNKKTGDKKYVFGRRFQLARTNGNFVIVGKCTDTDMNDKYSVEPIMELHHELFDAAPDSVATDKGYYSKKNEKILDKLGVKNIGIQSPINAKDTKFNKLPYREQEALINRRSGIEPIIGHIKHRGQLGRSRMKSDKSIEASGYTSVLGFNLRQLVRRNTEKIKKKAA